ncbi:MAG TPA: tetratricopeptide repeat protein, partial [Candidatus Limnocylindrales bacterium]|nr:tetratricopeptide repeat protein [Candidatus Limnocylindrales bacterium]
SPAIAGTLAYMAPEVLMGETPDRRADIFSLGVVFYEALTGLHPFRDSHAMGTVAHILHESPHAFPGPFPAGLDHVITRMLAKDPAQRYQTCEDVLADLRAVHAGRFSPAAALHRLRRATIRLPRAAFASFLVVLAATAFLLSPRTRQVASSGPRLLVVLPFKPAAPDANSRAFASGLTDTMNAKLGELANRYPLEMVGASEVRAQQVTDARQARSVLGASLALEGSMQQSGNTIRVVYSLVDTRSLRQMHSGVITADSSNPFAVQDRVIEEVLSDLDIDLANADRGRMISHGTTQPQAYSSYLRGQGYLQEYDRPENLDKAVASFQEGLAADPRFALAYAGLGRAYLKKYDATHSPEFVTRAADACSRAVALDRGKADGQICLGVLFNTTGKYAEAARHLELAVKLAPNRDESYRELALAYEGLRDPDRAESLLKKAISLRPDYWAGYQWLGAFYAQHGYYHRAVEQFKRVVELAPDSFSGYSNLGAMYDMQGNYNQAIAVLEKSISIRPAPAALNNLGAAYFYQGRYQDSAGAYERAAQMTPGDFKVFGNLGEAYGHIPGEEVRSRENYARALEMTEQRLSTNSHDAETLSYSALYAARLGQKVKAERSRAAALNLSARDPGIRLNSALVLAHFHQDARALDDLERAVKDGLSVTEITNDPAWRRFSANPRFVSIINSAERAEKK